MLFCLAVVVSIPVFIFITDQHTNYLTLLHVLPPLAVTCFMFSMKWGEPRNWWIPFYGIQMSANTKKLGERERAGEDPAAIQKEIRDWVASCTRSRSHRVNNYTYKFLRKGDAMMFKLAWG
jgi:hypothetical protein